MPSSPNTFRQPPKGPLNRLWSRITGRNEGVPKLARQGRVAVFLDAAQVTKRFRIADRAIADARQNMPPPEAVELSGAEAQLQSECNKALKTLKDEVRSRAARSGEELDRLRSRLKLSILNNRLEELLRTVGTDTRSVVEAAREELTSKKKTELRARAYFNWFRKYHTRIKSPNRPLGWFTILSVLGLSVAVETAINSDSFSLAGGGMYRGGIRALSISLFNVVISYSVGVIFGRMCYYTWKRGALLKILGIVITAFWALALFPAHLFIAHWRDYLVANAASGGSLPFDVIERFTQRPFGLEGMETWTLFVAGLSLGLFALLKGMRLANDPYPGYGAAGQELESATKDVEDGVRAFRGKMDSIEKRATEQSESLLNDYDDVILDARAKLSEFDHLVESYEEARHQIEMVFITCISEYRRENVETRTYETPKYFFIEPELDGSFSRDFAEVSGVLEELETERQYAAKSVGLFRDRVQKDIAKRRRELEAYLDTLGGIAKEELMREDPFFLEHGGADIMPRSERSPKEGAETGSKGRSEAPDKK